MNRLLFIFKTLLLIVLTIYTPDYIAQTNPDPMVIAKKYNIDPDAISPSDLPKLEARIKVMQSEGLSEEEIVAQLRKEGLIPSDAGSSANVSPQPSGLPAPPPNLPSSPPPKTTSQAQPVSQPLFTPRPSRRTITLPTEKVDVGIYGHHIFQNGQSGFNRSTSTRPSDDYIVGPGDVFGVTIWGCSELSESLTVEDDGAVIRPYIGKVYVGGLTYSKARRILMQKYKTVVSDCSNMEIFIGESTRTISVNIVGNVARPGAYKINAAVPAFNALFEAEGVTQFGSVRNIQIKRDNGKTVQILDLYEYLLEGKTEPIFLQENDFIYVPVQEKIARISGAVKRPMKYELKESENLKALIHYAGGLNVDALRNNAQISRIEDQAELLIDFDLRNYIGKDSPEYSIREGDEVIIKRIKKEGAFNIVSAQGSFEYPDTYQLLPGERVTDLIEQAGGLRENTYMKRAYVVRTVPETNEVIYIPIELTNIFAAGNNANNIELQYDDVLKVFSKGAFQEDRYITITGMVRNPGTFKLSPTMSLKDLLYLAQGPSKNADLKNIELSVLIQPGDINKDSLNAGGISQAVGDDEEGAQITETVELTEDDTTALAEAIPTVQTETLEDTSGGQRLVRRIAIDENWEDDPNLDTLLISEYNYVKIYSKYDFIYFRELTIGGQVNNPGSFRMTRGMNLKDAIYLAGGLTEDADVKEVELYRYFDMEERGVFNLGKDRPEVTRVTIDKDWRNSAALDSFDITSFSKIIFRSETTFFQRGFVQVKGLVNKPGQYEILPNMTLMDLLYMVNGVKLEADVENIELSRVIETLNDKGELVPVPIVVNRISTIQNWRSDSALTKIRVNTFDQVFVRPNPDFKIQESVFIRGEVLVPGEYNKIKKDERLSSLVSRASGVTELAYLKGAHLERVGAGKIAIKLHRALRNPGSRFDIPILKGDVLFIPPRMDFVSVKGNVIQPNTSIIYNPLKRRLKYYVRQAGGFDKKTKRKLSSVAYVDGRRKSPRKFLGFMFFPKVERGATITIARKPEKKKKEKNKEREPISLSEVFAGATALLTFYLLIDRVLGN